MAKQKPAASKVRRPTHLLFREVELNLGGLFKALPKAVFAYNTGKWDDAIAAAVDLVKSLFTLKKRTAEEQAYLLIRRSLTQAVADLISSATTASNVRWTEIEDSASHNLDQAVNAEELAITDRFFKAPHELKVLKPLEVQLGTWFRASGLSETQSRELAACLPEHFVVALGDEWRRNSADFEKLASYAPGFAKAEERERHWSNYRTWLQLQADPQLFDETFSLSSVYVELRSFWEKAHSKDELNKQKSDSPKTQRMVGRLKDQIDAWLEAARPRDSVRVISGGPGSGKSVFAKRLAAEQAKLGKWRVILVPMHQFLVKSALRDGVQEFCRLHPQLPDDVLEPKSTERYLLIFDGLDELAKQGRTGQELAREFFDQVQVLTGQVNRTEASQAQMLVLICGRPVSVSSTRADELKEGQVLHALPFFLTKAERSDPRMQWRDSEALLEFDQRDEWWKRYGEVTSEVLEGQPSELKTTNLDAITAEPLLNYLVSLSRKGGFEFSDETNRNSIYDDLLRRVYKRDYDPRQNSPLSSTFEEFQRLLEEVALAAWHGGETRSTTHSRVKDYCQHANLNPLLQKIFPENPNAVVGSLFLAFYFRRSADRVDNEAAFEFTHKSFGEYLLACRLIREVEELASQHVNKSGRWNIRHSLQEWALVFGPMHMDMELWRFLRDGIRLRSKDDVGTWQWMLVEFINYQQSHGLPMESLVGKNASGQEPQTFDEMNRRAINAEAGLLEVLGACAQYTQAVSAIQWPSRSAFREWLDRLSAKRFGGASFSYTVYHFMPKRGLFMVEWASPLMESLSYLGLANQDLNGLQLSNADLRGCDLSSGCLYGAILISADLSNTNLSKVHAFCADFVNAKLCNANVSDAKFHETDFTHADFSGAQGLSANFLKTIRHIVAKMPNGSVPRSRERATKSSRKPPTKS